MRNDTHVADTETETDILNPEANDFAPTPTTFQPKIF